jgi:hypothetical protein
VLGRKTFKFEDPRDGNGLPTNTTKCKHAHALLAVCRQLFAETALLPFTLNTFSAEYLLELCRGLRVLKPYQTNNITSINVPREVYIIFDEYVILEMNAFSLPALPRL